MSTGNPGPKAAVPPEAESTVPPEAESTVPPEVEEATVPPEVEEATVPPEAEEATVPSEVELAGLVERFVGALWWRINSELPSELSRTSASILENLREQGPQRVTALAAREQVAQPTMSVIVKRLGVRGLVERRADPEDRRATLVAITPLGLDTLGQRAQLRSRWFARQLADLGTADRCAVAAAVAKLMETFG